jgi:polyisoprenoid-binding protein YceI
MLKLSLALATLMFAPPAAAQMPKVAPGAQVLSQVVAGTYAVEPAHSQVIFSVNHLGFSEYSG